MIKIRLSRVGSKNNPFYRIVATEKSRKRGGKPLNIIGYWHPKGNMIQIDKEKLNFWQSKGAKITQAVSNLI
ncbi:MAG: 30S ribosomal protein S16 [Microgenomates group bacterium GW2011_GWC1_37_8]|uniref:Small ribosomal subunit protein bS16 n=1 Tax=Candidatus Woesebacteria bacterium GW2011_GWB1_38_8 TaxID=1618570 RepID=A0A0G0LD86_9BACT|nr:MAG: 30S ribosomal protein S16 [Microgenomates group bacterium GW2011_GWC1_37_8]KKQ85885.1 MAG: 30S ribosomal protein S16 [Candidatus Woesebacteria bacterium GW2011_GWB1_38_8]